MKTVIQKTLMGALIFFAALAAQAKVYCSADCTINYKDILNTLHGNATASQKEDFRADCSHRSGTLSGDGYSCFRAGSINDSAAGAGEDVYEARQSTRENCNQKARYYSNASSSVANFRCDD